MTTRALVYAAALLVFVGLTPAPLQADGMPAGVARFEVTRSRTTARLLTSASGARLIHVAFTAELTALPDLRAADVDVGWQEVGGVEPEPFRVLIPAGCFVGARALRVEDFRSCGVVVTVGQDDGRATVLALADFAATIRSRDDGTHRFDVDARVFPPDPIHALLGIVGGAAVRIAVGSETSAVALPDGVATVSGIDPEPF